MAERSGRRLGRNLTAEAEAGTLNTVIGRTVEIRRAIHVLSRRTRNNPVLAGPPGAGKTAVVEGLAQLVARGAAGQALRGKQIHLLDLDAHLRSGELPELLDEIKTQGEVLLVLDIADVVTGGRADVFIPAMQGDELQVIFTGTQETRTQAIEVRPVFRDLCPVIEVSEMTADTAVKVLNAARHQYEMHHRVEITDEAIGAAVTLAGKHIKARRLPGSALDLLDEVCAGMQVVGLGDLVELSEKITDAHLGKQAAIDAQDFDRAMHFRLLEQQLTNQRTTQEQQNTGTRRKVNADDVSAMMQTMLAEQDSHGGYRAELPDPFSGTGTDIWTIS